MFSVAVIILNWNGKKDTLACVKSVTRQEFEHLQIVIVDNASTDDSVSVFRKKFPNLKILENKTNLGYAAGNNIGIRYALDSGSEYVLVLNNDTVLDPECIRELQADLISHPEAAAAGPKSCFYDKPDIIYFAGGEVGPYGSIFHVGYGSQDIQFYNLARETEWLNGCAIMFTRRALLDIGLYYPDYFLLFEDIDWSFRAIRLGYSLRYVPQAKLLHKGSASFGKTRSPLYTYYYKRKLCLWIERNFPFYKRPRLYHQAVYSTRDFSNLLNVSSISMKKKFEKAIWFGFIDYLLRRFGKCTHSSFVGQWWLH